MNKPLYLLPFIFVYKVVSIIFNLIISIPRYVAIGFFFVNISVITLIINGIYIFMSLFLSGFIYLSFLMYKIISIPSMLFRKKEHKEKSFEIDKSELNEKENIINSSTISLNSDLEPLVVEKPEIENNSTLESDNDISLVNRKVDVDHLELKEEILPDVIATKNAIKLERKAAREIARARLIYNLMSPFVNFFKYYFYGFMFINFVVYKFIKYIVFGFLFPFVFVFNIIVGLLKRFYAIFARMFDKEANKKRLKKRLQKEEQRKKIMQEKRRKAIEKLAAENRKKEEEARKKEKLLAKKREAKEANEYINDKVQLKKRTMGDRINDVIESFMKIPAKIKESYNNISFIKNKLNMKDIQKEALLISFEGEDAEKSAIKILYEYVAKNPEGKIVKNYFEAFSKVEVHSFLLSEGFEVYSIRTNKWIQFLYGRASTNKVKFKMKDLIFFLTQLSTYIKAGIPLVQALKILSRQFRQRSYQRIFKTMIYDLTMGENFSTALEKQGVAFPRLLINMVKAAEMTGELPEALDNMAEYYTETDKTRKQMVTAMIYPSIVFIMSVGVITFIIIFVIPKFVDIYKNMDADQIPGFTLTIISISGFLEKNIVWVFLGFALFVLLLYYLYKNVKMMRTLMQWIVMRFPIMGNIVIYNEVTIFTKTFASLLSHNVFITDSMEVLNKITNNEIYKMIILDTINNLAKGEKISKSFGNHWAFPIPAYEMLVTGEQTGQLPEMMSKVSDYYQELHKNSVVRFKALIEPILIVFLTFVVGAIILAVIIPMFSMFTMIK